MKTLQQYLDEYAGYHQKATNKIIHIICVPSIVWSLLGLVWLIPMPHAFQIFPEFNWAKVLILICTYFYFLLSKKAALIMLGLSIACLYSFEYIKVYSFIHEIYIFVGVFLLAWLGQFIGHIIEGNKPAFFKDLLFLLIGPLWVLHKLELLQGTDK